MASVFFTEILKLSSIAVANGLMMVSENIHINLNHCYHFDAFLARFGPMEN